MKCQVYKFLYKMVPIVRWRVLLMDRHFSRCPLCIEALAAANQIDSIGITPETVDPGVDLWPGVENRLAVEERVETPAPKRIKPRPRTWGWALAGAAVLTLALLIPPALQQDPASTGEQNKIAAQDKKIIINSVTVENRPAKTFYFQPENKDRLIIWVKKM
jgi:hypothetical protein